MFIFSLCWTRNTMSREICIIMVKKSVFSVFTHTIVTLHALKWRIIVQIILCWPCVVRLLYFMNWIMVLRGNDVCFVLFSRPQNNYYITKLLYYNKLFASERCTHRVRTSHCMCSRNQTKYAQKILLKHC